MAIEIIGILPHRFYSEVYSDPVSEFDMEFIRECARAHEAAGYDRVLIANSATYPDSLPLASWVIAKTDRLKVMIAHRPGFVAPTMAARMLATLDRLAPGRVGVHIITGTNDVEMRADGDYLTKDVRYGRSREFVEVMKRMWSSDAPFDHHGEHYRAEGAFAAVKPANGWSIPVFWGGSSPAAVENGAKVADIYALAGGAREAVLGTMEAVRSAAPGRGRDIEFLLSTRVILGDTEEAAWTTAHAHLRDLATELSDKGGIERQAGESRDAAIDRVTAAAAEGSRVGRAFTGFAKVKVGRPIANCLVGTPAQIIDTLADLAHAGVSRFILAGYDPRRYPAEFGRLLLPGLRAAVAPLARAS